MPLFHIHGLVASLLAPLKAGSGVVLPPRLAPSFWKDFVAHGATWYTATPTMHKIILSYPEPSNLPEIRFIRSCSSPLSPQMLEELEMRYKTPVLEAYAMTEASHQITSNALPPAEHRAGTVGNKHGVEIKLFNADEPDVVASNMGEICIKGPTVFSGYRSNPSANAIAFNSQGFFRTGDIGKFDAEGYLTIVGRIKEFINKGGEKVSPGELDQVISSHPLVEEAVVFAINDDMYGQDVGAAVKLLEGADMKPRELKKWIAGKVTALKVPKKVSGLALLL